MDSQYVALKIKNSFTKDMKTRNRISLVVALVTIINCFTSCSSYTGSVTPPVNNQSSKEVAIGKVSDALLGNTEHEIIDKNKRLFQENRDIERKTKSNIDLDAEINKEELLSYLKLNSNQRKIFDQSFEEYSVGKNAIMESLSMDDFEKKQKIIRLAKKRDERVIAVLDSLQKDIYQNYILKDQQE